VEAHEVKYGTKVRVTDRSVMTPPDSIDVNTGDVITIFRLDGMYCSGKDKDGNRVYISAWTQVGEI